ncbi:MAG: RNA-binding domain-containing protein [Desulfurococcaceae archaeon]
MRVRVEAVVNPTEDVDKVVKAVLNVFTGNVTVEERESGYKYVVGESSSIESLKKLHYLIRAQRILDTARSILLRCARGREIVFRLHKQVAYVGKASFVDEELNPPLGTIDVYVECSNPEKLIDWLAPPTSMGKPLWEHEPPRDL